MSRKFGLLIFHMALLGLFTVVLAQDQPTAYFERTPCSFDFPQRYHVECGFLVAPLHRDQPGSERTRIAAAILHTSSEQPQPDPVVFLVGGPGSWLIQGAAEQGLGPMIERWLRERDVILMDQRGIGESQPELACPEVDNLDTRAARSEDEAEAALMTAISACAARLTAENVDLSAYNTLENADDAADLPKALGYEQANYYGLSYGSFVVLNVMRRHPEVVRSVILEGVTAPDINPALHFGEAFEHALREMMAACAEDAACAAAFPDLETVTFALIEQLNAVPVSVMLTDPQTGQEVEAHIDGRSLIATLASQFYYPANVYLMPAALYAIAAQQLEVVRPFLQSQLVNTDEPNYSTTGAFYAYRCSDNVVNELDTSFEQGLQLLHPALEAYYRDAYEDIVQNCGAWNVPPAAPEALDPVVSDIPTLMLSGRFDPVTPATYAEHVLETLSHGYHFVFPTMGHGVVASSNRCGVRIVAAFTEAPDSGPDASCIDQEAPIQFLIPGQ
ncbi:MAG: alpha/beta fold hydrolase [Anaerolineae bacterium]